MLVLGITPLSRYPSSNPSCGNLNGCREPHGRLDRRPPVPPAHGRRELVLDRAARPPRCHPLLPPQAHTSRGEHACGHPHARGFCRRAAGPLRPRGPRGWVEAGRLYAVPELQGRQHLHRTVRRRARAARLEQTPRPLRVRARPWRGALGTTRAHPPRCSECQHRQGRSLLGYTLTRVLPLVLRTCRWYHLLTAV